MLVSSLFCLFGLLAGHAVVKAQGEGAPAPVPSGSLTNTADYPSLTGVPQCGLECFSIAAEDAGCVGILDTDCYCNTSVSSFTTRLVQCASIDCPEQLNAAENIAQAYCGVASTTVSFPGPTTTKPSGPNPTAGTNPTQAPGKGGAVGHGDTLSSFALLAGVVAIYFN